MERLTRRFKKMVTTPNVITEVSNLAGQLGEPTKTHFFSQMAKGVERLTEEYCPSLDACLHQYFAKCGVTDCAIMHMVRNNYLVITDDFRLAQIMNQLDIDVINFNHVRSLHLLKSSCA